MKFNLCLLFLSIFSAVALTYPSEMLEERACHPGRCTGYYSCCKNSPNHFCIPVPCNSATFGNDLITLITKHADKHSLLVSDSIKYSKTFRWAYRDEEIHPVALLLLKSFITNDMIFYFFFFLGYRFINVPLSVVNKLNQETESKKISIIQGVLDFIYYIRDYWCGDLAIGWCKVSILWINWLRLQPPHPKYYNTLDHQNLPYISLSTRDEAVKKFETNQVYSYHNSEMPSLSLLLQDSLHNPETTPTSHNEYEKTFHNSETPPPSSQDPKKFSLSLYDQENREPVHSSLNHNVAIWKQEHITLATNLLANLNELELIAKSINQLSVNVPNGIKEDAKQLNIEMAFILEKIDENEDIKNLDFSACMSCEATLFIYFLIL
ncbi:hypothetical protein RhiirA4_522559 [Rhizophagus irregularis]|uniref:Uncharacterized protein n=1 Tax=Rhizophagus irregularis TaxID=588596 RepID=A0A2I1HRM2_9GLOM|nr:hypothetical protein RhiirA4_522559 [Rhizophagus irregularis]